MRLRTKLCSAGVTIGMLAGGSLAALPSAVGALPAEIQDAYVDMTCVGADEDTQALLDAGMGGVLLVGAVVTPDAENPTTLATGQSDYVSFDVTMDLPQDLIDLAMNVLGVNQLSVTDFSFNISASGGGATAAPLAAMPDNFIAYLDPVDIMTTTASGEVTISDDMTPTVFELDDPFSFTVWIAGVDEFGNPTSSPLNLTCTQDAPVELGVINAGEPVTTASISGVVSDEAAAPIAGMTVDLRDASGLNRVAPITTTGVDGSYSFGDLPFGDYRIYVRPVTGQYNGMWFGQSDQRSGAATISLTAAGVADADVVLPDGGLSISGTVTAGGGLEGAIVDLRDATGLNRVAPLAITDVNGNYKFADLAPGDYKLYVRSTAGYEGRWYAGALQRAESVAIHVAGPTAGIDVALAFGI